MDTPPATPLQKRRISRWWWIALILPAVGLDFATLFSGKHYGQAADAQAQRVERAGTWLVWSMVGLMIFLGLLVGSLIWRFRKLARNPDPGRALLDELYQQELADQRAHAQPKVDSSDTPPAAVESSPSDSALTTIPAPPAWEKPGDWWRSEQEQRK